MAGVPPDLCQTAKKLAPTAIRFRTQEPEVTLSFPRLEAIRRNGFEIPRTLERAAISWMKIQRSSCSWLSGESADSWEPLSAVESVVREPASCWDSSSVRWESSWPLRCENRPTNPLFRPRRVGNPAVRSRTRLPHASSSFPANAAATRCLRRLTWLGLKTAVETAVRYSRFLCPVQNGLRSWWSAPTAVERSRGALKHVRVAGVPSTHSGGSLGFRSRRGPAGSGASAPAFWDECAACWRGLGGVC